MQENQKRAGDGNRTHKLYATSTYLQWFQKLRGEIVDKKLLGSKL